ncbi:hypothetical protein JTE90_019680 [Oedothorax gibbosus]|uniref:Uncharacterized protein n=1 Tax=Oedothorax gibbosus TaxID=931172 RepID=A0AAV6UZ60_9ARAC|nr:hypothetical protein JTE90_019680 [Oedothorax gibbosus]
MTSCMRCHLSARKDMQKVNSRLNEKFFCSALNADQQSHPFVPTSHSFGGNVSIKLPALFGLAMPNVRLIRTLVRWVERSVKRHSSDSACPDIRNKRFLLCFSNGEASLNSRGPRPWLKMDGQPP